MLGRKFENDSNFKIISIKKFILNQIIKTASLFTRSRFFLFKEVVL